MKMIKVIVKEGETGINRPETFENGDEIQEGIKRVELKGLWSILQRASLG